MALIVSATDHGNGVCMSDKSKKKDKERKPKLPRKATASYLENSALYYLERFSTSRANLERVLMDKVRRSVYTHDTDEHEGRGFVSLVLDKMEGLGFINDKAYAEMRVRTLRRSGGSVRQIRGKLLQKGVPEHLVESAIEVHAEEEGLQDPELMAAVTLARKRRFGPWCDPDVREERRDKQLATLARSGFSYDTSLTVIDAEDADELIERAEGFAK